MIRTRDFLLFVVIFVFILTGIVFTLFSEFRGERAKQAASPSLDASPGTTIAAVTTEEEMDRARNLVLLREKLLRGEGEISAGDPVFTSVDTPTTSVEQDMVAAEDPGERVVQYCASKTYSATALLWSLGTANIVEAEGARMVQQTKKLTAVQGSSTPAAPTTRTVLQLPLRPILSATPNCLDSEYVGIALDGSLIHNEEAWRYRNYASASVVGYARDGFPISGPGVDETLLDQCGGYNDGAGYRYYIRQNEMFVLGCYAAMPASFIEE